MKFQKLMSFYTVSDLKSPKTFRDLKKPIGALNPERLERLLVCKKTRMINLLIQFNESYLEMV